MIELNKIYNTNCIGPEGMSRIPSKSVDMILCDLPYGTTACKWDTIIPFAPLWEQYERVIKDNGAIVLTASQPFTTALISSNMKLFKYIKVWDKKNCSGFANAKIKPLSAHEDILVFGKGKIAYNPQMTQRTEAELKRLSKKSVSTTSSEHTASMIGKSGNRKDNALKYPTTVVRINGIMNRSGEKVSHPTQKPVALFEYLIKTYTHEGETVLDNCMGSGTTAIACINTNRNYIGFEWSPVAPHDMYYHMAVERVRKHQEVKSLPVYDLFSQTA